MQKERSGSLVKGGLHPLKDESLDDSPAACLDFWFLPTKHNSQAKVVQRARKHLMVCGLFELHQCLKQVGNAEEKLIENHFASQGLQLIARIGCRDHGMK